MTSYIFVYDCCKSLHLSRINVFYMKINYKKNLKYFDVVVVSYNYSGGKLLNILLILCKEQLETKI